MYGLSYTTTTTDSINISWSPPFTLPGTLITGYNISVISDTTLVTDYFTSNSYYELNVTDYSPCDQITITVSGYNGLNGENETITGIYIPSGVIYMFYIKTSLILLLYFSIL